MALDRLACLGHLLGQLPVQVRPAGRASARPDRKGKADTGIDLVARAADTGELTAVQCKFYELTHTPAKTDIDSFFTASGKAGFSNRIIISTTDKWGKNAEEALADQQIPVQRIGLVEIAEAPIRLGGGLAKDELKVTITPAKKHDLRPHQQTAVDAVMDGFQEGDRGKLIMACGTGKTFTALKLCERIAEANEGRARILFLVPSISLLSQTLREWTAQSAIGGMPWGTRVPPRIWLRRSLVQPGVAAPHSGDWRCDGR